MGRDSRSRSRRGAQYRRHHHSGRRSPSPRRRDSRGRAPNRRDHRVPQGEDASQYPRTWQSTSSHYDTNKEYGLPFPRMIESTQWSRKHQIAGLPVDQIRVVDMVPKGIQNYGLRLVANGRYVAFEMFRTRLDALIASTLFKELYRQKDSIDVCKVLGHFSSSDSDLNEWTVKQEAVQAMCENIVTHLKQFMPQESDQALLNQIEELRRQNAELTAQCKSQTENPPNPPSAPSAKAAGIGSFFAPSSSAPPAPAKAAPSAPPSSKPRVFEQFRRPEDKPPAFGTQPPEGYGKAKIDAWIRKFVPKPKQAEVDTLCRDMIDEYKTCEVGDQPNLESILTDWGLTSQILSKASIENQIRLLAAVQHVKDQ